MNYIVEDNFDFYNELKEITNNETEQIEKKICMISHEPLTYNSVTLSCNHSFNYMSLYNELCLHNIKQFIYCPYCRIKSDKLIPFIPLPGVTKISGVNYPTKLCMPANKCSFANKNGLKCEHSGIEYEYGVYCNKHNNPKNLENDWTPEKEKFSKTKSVIELKAMLRGRGLKVGGTKKELINRWFT
jgi:hypothetical protein